MCMKTNCEDSRARSVAKGLTWRMVASGTTMALVFIATGSLETMAAVGAFEVSLKLMFYYGHERVWGSIPWGIEPVAVLARNK